MAVEKRRLAELASHDAFVHRHNGPDSADVAYMLGELGIDSMETLIEKTIPRDIRLERQLNLEAPRSEAEALDYLKRLAQQNKLFKTYIGQGYYNTHTPAVIARNVLENPGWYTAYTPYQPEIAQGRLEGLLNFQQMVMDLTGMDLANASLLDEATAAAEAMALCRRANKKAKTDKFFVADDVLPQTLDVLRTRAAYYGFELIIDRPDRLAEHDVFGALLQYPGETGRVHDLAPLLDAARERQVMTCVAADLMSLALLKEPGAIGADVVLGNSQRFGVPMGYGGPHAAFFATTDQHKRSIPGRIIGVSKDSRGNTALRMAMQTREQHIRREKATSNICTSQALLANIAGFYAVYHGAEGLRTIASRIHRLTTILAEGLKRKGLTLAHDSWFDTLTLVNADAGKIHGRALTHAVNLRFHEDGRIGISLDETTTAADVATLFDVLLGEEHELSVSSLDDEVVANGLSGIPADCVRESDYLTHPNFTRYRSETEMLRYLKRLENRDLSLTHAMIPLGSCTMKLNATSEMMPITWPEFANLHPFVPGDQAVGYKQMIDELAAFLVEITGYEHISMQPNSGAQGEYAGLVAIRRYQAANDQGHRDICLIPSSAHGTNPASAAMAQMKVVVVECDKNGNIDLDDLRLKAEKHSEALSAIMLTYPSTHGVFEEEIREACDIVHRHGGQVYIDGANMNAQVGLCRPGDFGGDVSHLNLHKTFCIPHGGGGPGMGPIGVKTHLAPFVSNHVVTPIPGVREDCGAVSAAAFGSASILPISWAYIKMMGTQGLREATELAILNANYIAKRLETHYPVLYRGVNGTVAHECIVDIRPLKAASGISEEDIAKRLMDYGFHAPTMSFPVPGTLMIEPTESESRYEVDRFCDAMIAIREEIARVESGEWPVENNPLVNAPHTMADLMDDGWERPYSREIAAFPTEATKTAKFWPAVNRVDNVYGDRQLICSCPTIDAYRD
ncbi:aminomethyl-transferring glycine dehydrogenase [Halomonas sp. McH1-25]|uniref:aminomethyl-transferring glycine dehydrogenase n=1 Tax=unclassified Halomonas TaxID=2609666 RepID=UPI001EF747E2|nr:MULTISPECIES: aminomethyl-transferring glycine dehydrogenase [unclassified Halomonas]MCG7598540.1 aminomethyl-transferring glycine dehydrogenase [Halomonas sp. McH1-25]MCP1341792.1 aminomethyl-transferring glycine dehydrogenase [Halomonas sp. FL8]MCP1361009.1 aminomethyl-transferring glycine dehydrogenase [Halomonas sp. BBD45]MCP1365913.1 aminomethyl-transferring glycine dehydrogenase [Halomonas sp. BBD48]